jgi:TatD DNase family protein
LAPCHKQEQIAGLTAQIELALEHDLPVILHCRQAFGELLSVLRDYAPPLQPILHGFSRGPELAEQLVRFNCAIAFGAMVAQPKAKAARAAAQVLPLDYMLLESDAPRGAQAERLAVRSEPSQVRQIAAAVASLRGISVEEIAQHTTANARRIFKGLHSFDS